MQESLNMRGQLTLRLTDQQGRLVQERQHRNRIVHSGRRLVAQLFGGVTVGLPPTRVTHVGIGTGATAASDIDLALVSQRGDRNELTEVVYTDFDEPVPGGTDIVKRTRVSLTAVFDFGQANGAEPLREAGIFTAATGGIMYNRVVFEPVVKTDTFRLTLLWDIVF